MLLENVILLVEENHHTSEIFGSATLANDIFDRLLHHSKIIFIKGPSYRLKEKQALLEAQADE